MDAVCRQKLQSGTGRAVSRNEATYFTPRYECFQLHLGFGQGWGGERYRAVSGATVNIVYYASYHLFGYCHPWSVAVTNSHSTSEVDAGRFPLLILDQDAAIRVFSGEI